MVTSISSLSLAADSRQLRFYHPVQEQLPNSSSTNTATATTTTKTTTAAAASRSSSSSHSVGQDTKRYEIPLTTEEEELFALLREVTKATGLETTLRVAGGWVRDKLLATTEFQRHNSRTQGERLTSKIKKPTQPSMGRQGTKVLIQDTNQPVDIDIALDDMLGREFADHLNEYLSKQGQETVSVGVVLKNPEKSKHLETATMKVGAFWIDFVNLRAEEYTQDSRIPDLMRIGTPLEDAMRRDLTINALFYNINQQIVEDFTGRGCDDLRRGIVSTPLAPLTTLLDDPLRVLRSVRFAARLRFNIEDSLVDAAKDEQVRTALAQKVSRERVGGEVDLMLRSPDAVGAMNLLINLNLAPTVFPIERVLPEEYPGSLYLYTNGLHLLSTAHDHLCECKMNTPLWCKASHSSMTTHGYKEATLLTDEEARRLLWYAAFLKPLMDYASLLDETKPRPGRGKKSNRSVVTKLLVDELKRPARDAESVDKIIAAADDFSMLINHGCDWTAQEILLNDIQVTQSSIKEDFQKAEEKEGDVVARKDELGCAMKGNSVCSETEQDPLWQSAMQFRLLTSKVLQRVGHLWRAALMLSLSEQLVSLEDSTTYAIEGDVVRAKFHGSVVLVCATTHNRLALCCH